MSNIFGYIKESINEGDGLRSVVFFSGCHGLCEECHNPDSWNFNTGVNFTDTVQQRIIDDLKDNPLLHGVTFCGGEPFMSAKVVTEFAQKIRDQVPRLNIWSYSGFTFEEIVQNRGMFELLKEIDVLIDGKFIAAQKDLTLVFRGSANQRIIDVQRSLKENKVVLYDL